MNRLETLRDLQRHFDWASDRLINAASKLASDQLDHPFEMGFGSLRTTLWHIRMAEHVWLGRVAGESPSQVGPGEMHHWTRWSDCSRQTRADQRQFDTSCSQAMKSSIAKSAIATSRERACLKARRHPSARAKPFDSSLCPGPEHAAQLRARPVAAHRLHLHVRRAPGPCSAGALDADAWRGLPRRIPTGRSTSCLVLPWRRITCGRRQLDRSV